jgi:hypothetical protein
MLTFLNKNLSLEHKDAIIKLLKIMSIVSRGIIVKLLDLIEN